MIIVDQLVQRPTRKATTLQDLRLTEVRLLQQRALEIQAMGLNAATPRIAKLLREECDLVAKAPSGIQGWNCLGPTEEPTVVLVGQNPYMMSYVEDRDDVIENLSEPDKRALWLATGIILSRQGEPILKLADWKRRVYDTGLWLSLMKEVAVRNAFSYRYFVRNGGNLHLVTSLESGQRTLGSNSLLQELDGLSEEVLLATVSQRSVAYVIVAHKATATRIGHLLPSAPPDSESLSRVHLMGCYNWSHPDCWQDIPAMIMKASEAVTS